MGAVAAADPDGLQELKTGGESGRGLFGGPLGGPGSQGTDQDAAAAAMAAALDPVRRRPWAVLAAADPDDLQELKTGGQSERGLSGGPLDAPEGQGTAAPLIGYALPRAPHARCRVTKSG